MKKAERLIYFIVILLLALIVKSDYLYSQSPYFTMSFSITDENSLYNAPDYKIEVTTCKFDYAPVVPSGDYWFGKDTSLLNWENLPDSMIKKLV